jgi:hypothetical protein
LEENEEDQSNIFKTPGLMQFNNAADMHSNQIDRAVYHTTNQLFYIP